MRRDDAYLLDILIAARRAIEFLADLTWEEFAASDLHQNAVVRTLEIIGEAASRVSQDTRDAHPNIPWPQMIGMRHRLIHEYFHVDLATVWDTVKNDLPPLIALLEPLIPPEDEG
ncbi:MAG: DUF86 domain-containing protein [Anaerolineae bacterium]|jgi:uncharacterized protein with HEPN domain